MPARPGQPGIARPLPKSVVGQRFTYFSTWQGFVYVAFIIDVFAR